MITINGDDYTLEEALQIFLSEYRSADNGSWAKPTKEDMELFNDIVYEIIEQKFERDCDNDLPIRYFLLDRTRYQPLLFENIPHTNIGIKEEVRLDAIENYASLVKHYSDRLDAEIKCLRRSKGLDL